MRFYFIIALFLAGAILIAGSGQGIPKSFAAHSSDTNGDFVITASEIMRVIQLYNLGEYHCDAGTEDGFAPGPGDQSCTPHDADYAPQDWRIDLSELLRVLQIYNLGLYEECGGSEDGFCPSPPGLDTVQFIPGSSFGFEGGNLFGLF